MHIFFFYLHHATHHTPIAITFMCPFRLRGRVAGTPTPGARSGLPVQRPHSQSLTDDPTTFFVCIVNVYFFCVLIFSGELKGILWEGLGSSLGRGRTGNGGLGWIPGRELLERQRGCMDGMEGIGCIWPGHYTRESSRASWACYS